MLYDYSISIAQAVTYTGYPARKWFRWINEGLIPTVPEPPPDVENLEALAASVHIPVNSLPYHAANRYLQDHMLKQRFLNFDFVSLVSQGSLDRFAALAQQIQLLRKFCSLRAEHPLCAAPTLHEFAQRNGLSLSSLYRLEAAFMSCELKKLFASPPSVHSHSLCLLAEDFLVFHFLRPNHPSQNQLLLLLQKEADQLGNKVCAKCPYNPQSRTFAKEHTNNTEASLPLPICSRAGGGLIVPDTRYPVNRLLRTISQQEICLWREGRNAWEARFAHKTLRDKSPSINHVWYGDHHLADVIVQWGTDKSDAPLCARPWLTVFTDAASDAIVGSVVALRPNTQTIAECFCRAVAFTVDSPFYGLPQVIYVDRGKDYRSVFLNGRKGKTSCPQDATLSESPWLLNHDFCSHPFFPAFNVKVIHALPRTGRSKTIERVFGTLTRQWFSQLPGWTGASPKERPFDFEKEKKRLLASGQLWSLEKFAHYWFEVIVPEYNQSIDSKGTSPLERYRSLPRADTLVPDWNTLAVFKSFKNVYKVHPQGIKYNKEFYWHPDLKTLVGERVQVFDFDQTFCHSITVLHQGKYICEAMPLVHSAVVEQDRLKLAQHMEEQRLQYRLISRRVTRIRQFLKTSGASTARYAAYTPKPFEPDAEQTDIILPAFAEEIDATKDAKLAVIYSQTASEIGKAVRAQKYAISLILGEPTDAPISDFLSKLGAEP